MDNVPSEVTGQVYNIPAEVTGQAYNIPAEVTGQAYNIPAEVTGQAYKKQMSKKEMYKRIYSITYVAIINNLIDEIRYINVLQRLSMVGFKTYHINNFDKLAIYMKSLGLDDSFNISILIHFRDINYKKIADIATIFEDIGIVFSYKRKSMINRINKIRAMIKTKLITMRSFRKMDKMSMLNLINTTTSSIDIASDNYQINDTKYCELFDNILNNTTHVVSRENNNNNINAYFDIICEKKQTIDCTCWHKNILH
jgi:hypothetical protein